MWDWEIAGNQKMKMNQVCIKELIHRYYNIFLRYRIIKKMKYYLPIRIWLTETKQVYSTQYSPDASAYRIRIKFSLYTILSIDT